MLPCGKSMWFTSKSWCDVFTWVCSHNDSSMHTYLRMLYLSNPALGPYNSTKIWLFYMSCFGLWDIFGNFCKTHSFFAHIELLGCWKTEVVNMLHFEDIVTISLETSMMACICFYFWHFPSFLWNISRVQAFS